MVDHVEPDPILPEPAPEPDMVVATGITDEPVNPGPQILPPETFELPPTVRTLRNLHRRSIT